MTNKITLATSAALAVGGFAAAATPVAAQPTSDPAARSGAGSTFEIESRQRWLHPRRLPDLSRFREDRGWVLVEFDLPDPARGERVLGLSVDRGRQEAELRFDERGSLLGARGRIPAPERPYGVGVDSVQSRHFRYFADFQRRDLRLPEFWARELAPARLADRLRPGERWSDTLDLRAVQDEFAQTWTGPRTTTVLGDTVLDGRTLWVVHELANVRAVERLPTLERTMRAFAVQERTLEGVHRGTYLYDPSLGLYRERHDTTELAGERVLTLPDGRAYSTPLAFERTRVFRLRDASGTAARQQELLAQSAAQRTGMLILPGSPLAERLADDDSLAADSLVRMVRDEGVGRVDRLEALEALQLWYRPRPPRLDYGALRLLVGDTAWHLANLATELTGWREPVTVARLEEALPFMRDPGLAHAFGLEEEPFYENLRQGVLAVPPALTPDTSRWRCVPDACALLARQWRDATEPRLRDLGLTTAFALDPGSWVDTLRARAPDSPFLLDALRLADGAGWRDGAGGAVALPEPGADWRAWAGWLRGDPSRPGPARDALPVPRESSVNGLRMVEHLAGRDVVAELESLRATVEVEPVPGADTAVAVLTLLLTELGAAGSDPQELVSWFRSDSDLLSELARRRVLALVRDPARTEPAEPALAVALVDRLLGIVTGRDAPWPAIRADPSRRAAGFGGLERHDHETFLRDANLPPGIAERWSERLTLLGDDELRARPSRAPGTIVTVEGVVRLGPFVYVGYSVRTVDARTDGRIYGHASGSGFVLLGTPEGWVMVAESGWIT